MNFAALKSGVLVAALSSVAFAQTTIRTTTTLVVVPTLVQTPGKELVFSLKADDFILTDNGVPQKVTLEEETNRPLSLVVLMQTGGIARGQFESYANLDTMLAGILGKAPNMVSIVNFDSRVEAASPFTSDITEWRDAINHPDEGDHGAAILDSISYGIDLLKQEPQGNRRAILLISQEHDSGSKAQLKDIVRAVGETNTAIYSITFSAEKTAFKQASMRKNLSAEIANLSGGESSSFDGRSQLDEDLGVLTNHIRNSYILSFYPTSTEPGLHVIKVRLAHHPELLVSARSNYWAVDSSTTEIQH